MKKLFIFLFVLICTPTMGASYVNKTGNDTHGCSNNDIDACLTIQRGIDACPDGCAVIIGDGTYSENPSIVDKRINLNGNCGALTNVTILGVIYVQDMGTGGIQCIQTMSIQSRQYSIIDYNFVTFISSVFGHVNAGETSRINCALSNYINGNSPTHWSADDHSTISGNCTTVILGGSLTWFARATGMSIVNASNLLVAGSNSGNKCLRGDVSLIHGGIALPGLGGC